MSTALDAVSMGAELLADIRASLGRWRAKDAGNTDQRMAELSGIGRAMVTKFRNGDIDMSLPTLCRMCAVLGVKIALMSTHDRKDGCGNERCKRTKDMFQKEE